MLSFSAKTIRLLGLGLLMNAAITAQTDPVFRMPQLLDAFYHPAAIDFDQAASIHLGGRGDQGLNGDERYAYGLTTQVRAGRVNYSINYLNDRHVNYLQLSDGNPSMRRSSWNNFISAGAAYPFLIGSNTLSVGLRLGIIHRQSIDTYTAPVFFAPNTSPEGTWKKITYDISGGIDFRHGRWLLSAAAFHAPSQELNMGFPFLADAVNRTCYESIRYRIPSGETALPIDASITARQSENSGAYDIGSNRIHTVEGNFSVLFFQHLRSGIGVSSNNVQQHALAIRLGYEQKRLDMMVGFEPLTDRGLAGEFTLGWDISPATIICPFIPDNDRFFF